MDSAGEKASFAYSTDVKYVKPIDPILEKKAVRKLDLTIIPIMTLFYLLSFLVSMLLVQS